MEIGISLACFYPEHPEDVIDRAKALNFNISEVFINTFSELDDKYIESFKRKCDESDLQIYSVHPFTSAIEHYMFFSPYDRRIEDSVILYEKYCVAANKLGAKVINLHGDRGLGLTDLDKFISCLAPIIKLSEKHSVCLSFENVFFNSINHPEFIYKLRKKTDGIVKFTFDIKQAHKGGSDPYEVCEAMGTDIVNFHINDFDDHHICMLPGEGTVDYKRIFNILQKNKYSGPALIEVYNENFTDDKQIKDSVGYLNNILSMIV